MMIPPGGAGDRRHPGKNKDGETPLYWASKWGHSEVLKPEVVTLLLAATGIEVFKKKKEGKGTLDVASDMEVASLLQEVVDVKRT